MPLLASKRDFNRLKPGAVIKDIGIHDAKNMGKVPLKVLAVYLLEEEVSPSAALD